MKSAWVGEQLSRADRRNGLSFDDLLIVRGSLIPAPPVPPEEIARKFFRWVDRNEGALTQ